MQRTVLLRHELADGSEHFDWMLQRAAGGDLITFRVDVRFDDGLSSWMAERIGDHREAYLDFEGEIAGGRGRVERVASGACRVAAEGPSELIVELDLGEITGLVRGRAMDDGVWRFVWEG